MRAECSRRATSRRSRRAALLIEALEDRLAPAIVIWDGAADVGGAISPNGFWSNGTNWVGDVAPQANDVLVFPNLPSAPQDITPRYVNNNDFPVGRTFAELRFTNNGANGSYSVTGNALQLSGVGSGDGLSAAANTTINLTGITITVAQNFRSVTAGQLLHVQSPITLGANLTATGSGNLRLQGVIDDGAATFGLNKSGGGTLELTNTNTYNGATTISAGTLQLGGSIAASSGLSIAGGASLTGGGVVPASTVNGTLDPGTGGTGTAVFIVNGGFTLTSTSTFRVNVNGAAAGTGHDQVQVVPGAGPINITNSTLTLVVGAAYAPTGIDVLRLIDNQGSAAIIGEFAGLPDGTVLSLNGRSFVLDYQGGDGNDVVLVAQSGTFIWDGGGADNNWMTAANWVGDVAPRAGDNLVFPADAPDATSFTNTNNFPANSTFNAIGFVTTAPPGDGVFRGLYTIAGNAIQLAGGISHTLATPAPGATTFGLATTLLNNQTITNTSANAHSLNLTAAIALNGHDVTFSTSPGATTRLFGAIGGTGNVLKTGSGDGVLEIRSTSPNTYTGATTIAAGPLRLHASNVLPDASTVTIAGTATFDVNSQTETVGPLSGAGAVELRAAGQLTATVPASTTSTFSGALNGPATGIFTKAGAGTLVLSGTSNLTGTTQISAGTLFVSGTLPSAVIVGAGELSGNGSVTNLVNVSSGGRLGPEDTDAAGQLTVQSVQLTAGSTFEIQLNGASVGGNPGHDQLVVTSTAAAAVTLGGATLEATRDPAFIPASGSQLRIIDVAGTNPVVGTFSGLPEGSIVNISGRNFRISYVGGTGNDVVLSSLAVITWDGGGSNDNWTTPLNWVGDVAPAAGDQLVFPGGATRLANVNDFPAGTGFGSITFSGSGYTVTGNALTLTGVGVTSTAAAILTASHATGTNALNVPVTVGNANANQTVEVTQAGAILTLGGIIDDTGSVGLIKSGAGTLALSGANTYDGATQIVGGTLSARSATALGATVTGTTVNAGGTLEIQGTGLNVGEPLILVGGRVVNAGGDNTVSGTIQLNTSAATVEVGSALSLTASGIISGGAGLTKAGAGTLILTGTNNYSGVTTVNAGTLRVNGTQTQSNITVNSTGTLSGGGTVGAVTVNNGGTLAPGVAVGIMNTGSITFGAGSTLLVEVNGAIPISQYDVLSVTGTVTLLGPPPATLQINLGAEVPAGSQIGILINDTTTDPIAGQFNGVADGGAIASSGAFPGRQFRIDYDGGDGNDLVLTRTATPSFSFAVSASDRQVSMQQLDMFSGTSSGWTRVGPGQFLSVEAGVFGANAAPILFGIGLDQRVYEARFDAAGNLIAGWGLVAPGQFEALALATYGANNSPILFGVATAAGGRQVFGARFDALGNLVAGWFLVAPGQFQAITAASFGTGNAEVFGIGLDQRVYGARFDANGAFTSGWSLIAPGLFRAIDAATFANGTLELFGAGTDGQAYAANLDASGNLTAGWFPVNTSQPVGLTHLTAATLGNGNATVFALGTDGRAYQASFASSTGAKQSGWAQLATTLFSDLSAGTRFGRTVLYGLGDIDDQVYAALFDGAGLLQSGPSVTAAGAFLDIATAPRG